MATIVEAVPLSVDQVYLLQVAEMSVLKIASVELARKEHGQQDRKCIHEKTDNDLKLQDAWKGFEQRYDRYLETLDSSNEP